MYANLHKLDQLQISSKQFFLSYSLKTLNHVPYVDGRTNGQMLNNMPPLILLV